MTDFLLELRSEEIPARMQAKAREDLARLFAGELAKAGLAASETITYATPRRLTLIARGLLEATQAVSEETKGPKTSAPPQALEGFLRKTGLTREQLIERDGILFAITEKPGRATVDVLAEAIPAVIRAFPWPKSMRWGAASTSTESLRWVRPLQGIVALFGEEIVSCEIAGIASGAATVGHRFHHPGIITIGSAADYVEKLRACHVIVDQAERQRIIALGATMAANKAGLTLVRDEGLLIENAGLTEWPMPLLGRFDADYLTVPPEVIQLTARVNQKYFVCHDRDGKLANAFVCTANIDASDGGGTVVEGNRKVLAARLADARFFYDTDLKVPLEEQAKKLDRIVFHEKLGTVADKVERVAKLARWLVEEGIVKSSPSSLAEDLAALAERAARLCKADLVTGMVGEFPELQGVMGGYYALAQGEDPRVAAAIRDHYKPVGQGDAVPTDPVTVAVALADKLDTLIAFFAIGELPSGSRDPFALRRQGLGVIALILLGGFKLSLIEAVGRHDIPGYWDRQTNNADPEMIFQFLADRLKVQQREAGVRHDLIDAVFALGGEDDLVRLLARVHALQAFVGTPDGANLLAGYKRAANILKKEGYARDAGQPLPLPDSREGLGVGPSSSSKEEAPTPGPLRKAGRGKDAAPHTPEPTETALIAALGAAEPAAAAAIVREDFAAAMVALAGLRAPIDAFFTDVTVNDADPVKRAARLALLARVRDAVHTVADFSKIEG